MAILTKLSNKLERRLLWAFVATELFVLMYMHASAVGGGVIGNTGVGCNRVQMSRFITG